MYQRESRLNVFSTAFVSAVVALALPAAREEADDVEVDIVTPRWARGRPVSPSYVTAASKLV